MPKLPARRFLPDGHPGKKPETPLPPELRRQSDPLIPRPKRTKKVAVDYLARTQCVGSSKNRLKLFWAELMAKDGHKNVPTPNDPETWRTFSYGDILAVARDLGYKTEVSMLSNEIKAQVRCRNMAVAGAVVCKKHGGSAGQVIRNARENFHMMLMPAQTRLMQIVTKGKHEPAVVQALKEIFDITGMKKPEATGPAGGFSEEMIIRMAEVLTEEDLIKYIEMTKKIQNVIPDATEEEEDPETKSLPAIKSIPVSAAKMAELIKAPVPKTRKRA